MMPITVVSVATASDGAFRNRSPLIQIKPGSCVDGGGGDDDDNERGSSRGGGDGLAASDTLCEQ